MVFSHIYIKTTNKLTKDRALILMNYNSDSHNNKLLILLLNTGITIGICVYERKRIVSLDFIRN